MSTFTDRLAKELAEKRAYGMGMYGMSPYGMGGYGMPRGMGMVAQRGPFGRSYFGPHPRMMDAFLPGMARQQFQPQYQDPGSSYEASEIGSQRGAYDSARQNEREVQQRLDDYHAQRAQMMSEAQGLESQLNASNVAKMIGPMGMSPLYDKYHEMLGKITSFDKLQKPRLDQWNEQLTKIRGEQTQSRSEEAQNLQRTHGLSDMQHGLQEGQMRQDLGNMQSAVGRQGVHGQATPNAPPSFSSYQPSMGMSSPPSMGAPPGLGAHPPTAIGSGSNELIGAGKGMPKLSSWVDKVAFAAAKNLLSK